MTQYNSVSGVRFGLQIATAALFYAAARYKKVDGLTSAASRIGIAAVVQGVSQKVHAPLGECSKMSWLADGISLGLVAYGMSYTDLGKRTKCLAGAAIFGSQLIISNFKPNTALARIDKIETKEECTEVCAELIQLFSENKETITPEHGIKTCKALFQKAFSFTPEHGVKTFKAFLEKARSFSMGNRRGFPADQLLDVFTGFLDELQGWGKVKAQMEYIEVLDAAKFSLGLFVESLYFTEHLEQGEQDQLDLWMKKTGRPIQLRWSTDSMKNFKNRQLYDTITEYINGVGDNITFAQKLDLCDQFYIKLRLYINLTPNSPDKDFRDSMLQNMLVFREGLMDTLEGMEKAKAYMVYAEFLSENDTKHPALFDRIIPEIRGTLDENGQAAVDAWMDTKGTAIQEKWRR